MNRRWCLVLGLMFGCSPAGNRQRRGSRLAAIDSLSEGSPFKPGEFALKGPMLLLYSPSLSGAAVAEIVEEFKRAGLESPHTERLVGNGDHPAFLLIHPSTKEDHNNDPSGKAGIL